MTRLLRASVLLLTLGGAFAGISQLVGPLRDVAHLDARELIDGIFLLAYFVWGVTLGLLLVEGRDLHRQLVAYLLMQIPYITSPWFDYSLGLGLSSFCGLEAGGVSIGASLGVNAAVGFMTHSAWALKVNVVPIALIFALKKIDLRQLYSRTSELNAAPVTPPGPLTTRSSGR